MVDVGAKDVTDRRAVARAAVRMSPATAALVEAGDAPKGDVIGVARIAGIKAAKRTAELIPLCHTLPLSFVDVSAAIDAAAGEVGAARRPALAAAPRPHTPPFAAATPATTHGVVAASRSGRSAAWTAEQ